MSFYIRINEYWQNAPTVFFGPYARASDAQAALAKSEIVRADLGHSPRHARFQLRCLDILSAAQAEVLGMNTRNTYAVLTLPDSVDDLREMKELRGYP